MSRYQLFPALDAATEAALRASIARFGVLVPVVKDQDGNLLDGHHRSRIADELGVDYRVDLMVVADDEEREAIIATLNVDRGHRLRAEMRREVVADLRAGGHSLRAIAGAVGVTQTQVARDLATVTDVTVPARTMGLDGKSRPAKRTIVAANSKKESERGLEALSIALPEPRGSIDVRQAERVARAASNSDGDEWYTPRWLFDSLGLVYSIDVCSPADRTHVAVPAEEFYTQEDDGLARPWHGTVWCNPPYSTPDPWAARMVEHGDGLLLTHVPMNAEWCADVWRACSGIRLFQAMEFVRPDGTPQRPGYWLQLAAFGQTAAEALACLEAPPEVAENPRRVPSPMWVAR